MRWDEWRRRCWLLLASLLLSARRAHTNIANSIAFIIERVCRRRRSYAHFIMFVVAPAAPTKKPVLLARHIGTIVCVPRVCFVCVYHSSSIIHAAHARHMDTRAQITVAWWHSRRCCVVYLVIGLGVWPVRRAPPSMLI